jgi:predicted AlkP superfamily pyrophosphatase or phosphodiesterase
MNSRFKGSDSSYLVRDRQVRDQVVSVLRGADPDVFFAHFDQVDDFGHATGFSKTNAAYLGGIATVDGYVGDILAAMRARPQFKAENWCIIVTTDHGGVGKGHGGQSSDERTIWMIVNGWGAQAGRVSTEKPGHTCVPATALRHLGIALQPVWDIDPTVFGLN